MDDGLKAAKAAARPKPRHPDRVTLLPEHLVKLDGWVRQIKSHTHGVMLNRNDIITWLIGSVPAELAPKDERSLAERHYDDDVLLREAMREAKARKARGEEASLAAVVREWTGKSALDRPSSKPPRPEPKAPRENHDSSLNDGIGDQAHDTN